MIGAQLQGQSVRLSYDVVRDRYTMRQSSVSGAQQVRETPGLRNRSQQSAIDVKKSLTLTRQAYSGRISKDTKSPNKAKLGALLTKSTSTIRNENASTAHRSKQKNHD